MIDFLKFQQDLALLLLCDDWLANVNVVTRERLVLSWTRQPDKTLAAEVLAYLTPRNGRKGCGVIVEIPEIAVPHPNLPGPEMDLLITALILEDPVANEDPTLGTLKPADQVGQRILELAHHWMNESYGQLYAATTAMVADKSFEPLRAWRCRFALHAPRAQTKRTAQPTISETSLAVTLACTTSGAHIWYTTNQTFPGPANPAATEYMGTFSVTSGTIVRWAAYATDLLPSTACQATVT